MELCLGGCQSLNFLVCLENEEVASCRNDFVRFLVIIEFLKKSRSTKSRESTAISSGPEEITGSRSLVWTICTFSCDVWVVSVCVVELVWSVDVWIQGYNLTASSSSFLPHPRFERCRDLTTWGSSHWSCTSFWVVSSNVTAVCQSGDGSNFFLLV